MSAHVQFSGTTEEFRDRLVSLASQMAEEKRAKARGLALTARQSNDYNAEANALATFASFLEDIQLLAPESAGMTNQRINAYTSPAPAGGVVVDVQGIMVDLVTFIKAMAIQKVVEEPEAKRHFMAAIEECWDKVEVTASHATAMQ